MKRGEFLSEEENNEVEETLEVDIPRTPKKSSGILKKFAVCALALAMTATAAFSMAGCGNTKDPSSSITTPDTPTSSESTIDEPTSVDPEVETLPTEKITSLLGKMGTNYTYSFATESKEYNYFFDGDKIQIRNNKNKTSDYHYVDGDKAYDLMYDKETSMWTRYDSTDFDADSIIVDHLRNAEWTHYDDIQECFEGTVNGKEMTFYVYDESGVLMCDGYYGSIGDLGGTSVTLPTADKIRNADPTIDPIDPIEDTALYTIDANGNYVFNINAIQKAFMEITPNGNTLIDQVYKNCTVFNDRIVENVVFINPTKDNFKIGVLMHFDPAIHENVDTTTCLSVINDQNGKWGSFVSNPENNSIAKFKDFLLTTSKLFKFDSKLNQVKVEYTTIDADYETAHKEEFDKLTNSVMETVSEYGCKDTGISEYRDKIEEYKNAKVLFGIKTPAGKESAGLSMGYVSDWHQYYVLEVNGKLEFADFLIFSSTSNNVEDEKVNVINKNRRWHLIDSVVREELNPENTILYQAETKTQYNAQSKQVMFYEDKEREN